LFKVKMGVDQPRDHCSTACIQVFYLRSPAGKRLAHCLFTSYHQNTPAIDSDGGGSWLVVIERV
jgi:hypothetical protein